MFYNHVSNIQLDTEDRNHIINKSLLQYKHLTFGIVAIFIYVGCEVSVASFLINFAMLPPTAGQTIKIATIYLSLYWFGQMAGRLIGALFLARTNTHLPLACCGLLATILLSWAFLLNGAVSIYLITRVGLANSIMYPSIFSIAVKILGHLKSKGSGFLHMGVVGGSIIPIIQGIIADHLGDILSYWLPTVLYVYIIFYTLFSWKILSFREGKWVL